MQWMKNTKGTNNSFFPPWKCNGQMLGSIFLGFTTPQKNRKNFAQVRAPAPSYTFKIQEEFGIWPSQESSSTGDCGGVEPKHWVVCLTLLFPFLWTQNGKPADLGQLGPQGWQGEQCGMHWALLSWEHWIHFSLDLELSKQPLKTGEKTETWDLQK